MVAVEVTFTNNGGSRIENIHIGEKVCAERGFSVIDNTLQRVKDGGVQDRQIKISFFCHDQCARQGLGKSMCQWR